MYSDRTLGVGCNRVLGVGQLDLGGSLFEAADAVSGVAEAADAGASAAEFASDLAMSGDVFSSSLALGGAASAGDIAGAAAGISGSAGDVVSIAPNFFGLPVASQTLGLNTSLSLGSQASDAASSVASAASGLGQASSQAAGSFSWSTLLGGVEKLALGAGTSLATSAITQAINPAKASGSKSSVGTSQKPVNAGGITNPTNMTGGPATSQLGGAPLMAGVPNNTLFLIGGALALFLILRK